MTTINMQTVPTTTFNIFYLAGRCIDGAERDGGTLFHAVLNNGKSLCGKIPGKRSAGWFEGHLLPQPITCAICLKRAIKATEQN